MPIPDQEIVNTMLFNLSKMFPVTRVCKAHKIARSTYYYRLKRYLKHGLRGLQRLSRRPKRLAKKLPRWIRKLILHEHKQNPHYSPPRIANELKKHNVKVSDNTVRKYVREYDAKHQPKKPKRKIRKGEKPTRKFSKLERVQLDFKGWFWLNKRKVYPIGAIDCGTRVRMVEFCDNMRSETATQFMERFIAKYGKPEAIQTDNGSTFVSQEFNKWCKMKGIKLRHSPVGKPWYNGFIESVFKTLQLEFLDHQWFDGWEDAVEKLEQDDYDYNHVRYHGAIKSTPQERFCRMK